MTEPIMRLGEYVRKVGVDLDRDFLREGVTLLTRLLMELEMSEQIGAERYERREGRQTHRNGYRRRGWESFHCAYPGCAREATSPVF